MLTGIIETNPLATGLFLIEYFFIETLLWLEEFEAENVLNI